MSRWPSSEPSSDYWTIYDRFLRRPPELRVLLRDEAIELVRKSGLFRVDDLIVLLRAGYGQLSSDEKRDFEGKFQVELELAKHS
jgi:hypothetical protein